jgi:hypothetical protein
MGEIPQGILVGSGKGKVGVHVKFTHKITQLTIPWPSQAKA